MMSEYTFEGKKVRLEVTNMLKEMGCIWFVATDKDSGDFVEWNMTKKQLEDLLKHVDMWEKQLGK